MDEINPRDFIIHAGVPSEIKSAAVYDNPYNRRREFWADGTLIMSLASVVLFDPTSSEALARYNLRNFIGNWMPWHIKGDANAIPKDLR